MTPGHVHRASPQAPEGHAQTAWTQALTAAFKAAPEPEAEATQSPAERNRRARQAHPQDGGARAARWMRLETAGPTPGSGPGSAEAAPGLA